MRVSMCVYVCMRGGAQGQMEKDVNYYDRDDRV